MHATRPTLSALGLAAVLLTACAPDDQAAPIEQAVDSITRFGPTLADSELLTYSAFAATAGADDVSPIASLSLDLDRAADGTRGLGLALGDDVQDIPITSSGVALDGASTGAADELFRALPLPGQKLAVGDHYESAAPTLDRVYGNDDAGKATMVPHTDYTVQAIVTKGDRTVVRLETESRHRLFTVSRYGEIGHVDFDAHARGIVDLVHVADDGWRVLRLTRLTVDGEPLADTLAEQRAQRHHTFTACLDASTVLADTEGLHQVGLLPVPEFQRCRANATHSPINRG